MREHRRSSGSIPSAFREQEDDQVTRLLLRAESGQGRFTLLYFTRKETTALKEQLTAVFQQVPEGYIGFVEELPGANTQGDTLDEARTNLQEAVHLVLESNRALAEESLGNKTVIREPLASIS